MSLTEQTARQNLQTLLDTFHDLTPDDKRQMSEASVVRQFIDRLLEEVLGWPIKDPARYKYELHTVRGRPDLTLFPEKGGVVFVEAKRFGAIADLNVERPRDLRSRTLKPKQLALPGMAVDRTREEQQAINYAFENSGNWAILTNFEKLRLYNARRDWLVLSFELPSDYLDDFDLLWQLSYASVLNGSLDALSNERLTLDVDSDYLAFINQWRERLAHDVVDHLDGNTWAGTSEQIDLMRLRTVVQRYLDRLAIIRFAEDHAVIPAGALRTVSEARRSNPYSQTLSESLARFFREFDKVHNSALFARDFTDDAVFSDKNLFELIEKLYEARYRAMPADILGNTYEQYLGKALAFDGRGNVTTRDNLETRKKQGSYYTPQVLVHYIVDHSLGRYLYGTENGKPDGAPIDGEKRRTAGEIQDLRVLDSACGSGSFLIYAYQVLREFYTGEIRRIESEGEAKRAQLAAGGMINPLDLQIALTPYTAEIARISNYPRLILEGHLYGVDLDPQAAEIAVVNLVMRGIENIRALQRRSDQEEKRLPLILNQNVKVGNGLVGLKADDPRLYDHAAAIAAIRRLRGELISSAHDTPDHDRIASELRAATEALNAAFMPEFATQFSDVERIRPFHWGVEFPEVFYDADGVVKEDGGFTIIVGNPPWEIVKPDLREYYAQFDPRIEGGYSRERVEERVAELNGEDPTRADQFAALSLSAEQTSAYIRGSGDYTRQGGGDPATHKMFMERMYSLLRNGGRIGYVVPSGIYTDLGTKPLREMLLNEGRIESLIGLSNVRRFFPDVDSRFKFSLVNAQKGVTGESFPAAFRIDLRVGVSQDDFPAFAANPDNFFTIRREMIQRFNPDSLGIMEFQNKRDYEISEKIYDSHPVLGEQRADEWNVRFTREFDKTNDRALFNYDNNGLPVYEGENVGFYGDLLRPPSIWIEEEKGRNDLLRPRKREAPNLAEAQIPLDYEHYRFGFRRIARGTDNRTLVVSYLPKRVFAMYTLCTTVQHYFDGEQYKPYMTKAEEMFLYTCMGSYVLDYLLRFQITSSVAMYNIYSLPVPRLTAGDRYFDALVERAARLVCVRREFDGLWAAVSAEPEKSPPPAP
jgi:hypothetical protein